VPAYSLLADPLRAAATEAIRLARAERALVSLDLASVGPLLGRGLQAAREVVRAVAADVIFATVSEADAFLAGARPGGLTVYAPLAVVKRGAKGATVLQRAPDGAILRFEVATQRLATADTTGAGDAFDAGFIAGWLGSEAPRRSSQAALHRAALAGHRAAARQLGMVQPEIGLG
jgi:sugar/nucleoside kinase (ribokinase family)